MSFDQRGVFLSIFNNYCRMDIRILQDSFREDVFCLGWVRDWGRKLDKGVDMQNVTWHFCGLYTFVGIDSSYYL